MSKYVGQVAVTSVANNLVLRGTCSGGKKQRVQHHFSFDVKKSPYDIRRATAGSAAARYQFDVFTCQPVRRNAVRHLKDMKRKAQVRSTRSETSRVTFEELLIQYFSKLLEELLLATCS